MGKETIPRRGREANIGCMVSDNKSGEEKPRKDQPESEPQADIQADEAGKVGGADIKIGGDSGPGGPDIKTDS